MYRCTDAVFFAVFSERHLWCFVVIFARVGVFVDDVYELDGRTATPIRVAFSASIVATIVIIIVVVVYVIVIIIVVVSTGTVVR